MSNERPFTLVSPKLHSSKRYLALDDSGRALFNYVLHGQHQNSCGCSQIKPAYAAADLIWPAEKFLLYRGKLLDGSLVDLDADTDEIYIERWFKHHAKGSWKFGKGIMSQIAKIESGRLQEKVHAEFAGTSLGKAALEAEEAEQAAAPSVTNITSRLLGTRLMQRGG
ncbi:hypothetical protein [Mesorhizobium sp. LNJC394B00]|uniref:hypothetical protein n=1 Tax=Mesorhizobium sp. LNJC394B00 TaxID=1287274 RepID=UPI0003F69229|nr:hypothetical protein [Mesorhizobium sp. LNJC394B00]